MTLDKLTSLFTGIGLDEKKALELTKNAKLSTLLKTAIESAGVEGGCSKSKGGLLHLLATTVPRELSEHVPFLAEWIAKDMLKSEVQVSSAIAFLKQYREYDVEDLKKASGVGIEVTEEQIKRLVSDIVFTHRERLLEERYHYNLGVILKEIRSTPSMKWGDGKVIKKVFDEEIEKLLGPRTEADNVKVKKVKQKAEKPVKTEQETPVATGGNEEWKFEGEVLQLHKPGENPQIKEEIRRAHLEATGGKVVTRFPPEPNGFLHIGHAKAINFDFRYARVNEGICYLRYDDTNPEAEEEEYFTSIKESVEWLGFQPFKVTHSSDYFDQLYEYAIDLIKKDKAYVCHMTEEEIKESRGGDDHKGKRFDSPWRNRPVEESLKEFEKMKNGEYEQGEAVLRMKMDMNSPNPNMWDLVAYRVLKKPHVRTGDKWIIYPTYDFTHPICDSIENITHSFCTTEFILNRENYYWLCDALEIYKPVQWEFGRLNITNTVLSKRKIVKLIENKIVNGWDDPRLFTLDGIRRRGFTPNAINNFVKKVGITTAPSTIDLKVLESCVREDLYTTAPRLMAVIDPIKVVLTDFPENEIEEFEIKDEISGTRKIPFSKIIYIDQSDFRLEDDPNFKRLAPGKSVCLMFSHDAKKTTADKSYRITCTDYIQDENGKVTQLMAICDRGVNHKTKAPARIQWVAESPLHNSPIKAQVNLYSNLFLHENPSSNPDGWLADVNPNSLEIKTAFVDISAKNSKKEDHFQFLRLGFFTVDKDSTSDHLIFNRTVSHKEDSKKIQ